MMHVTGWCACHPADWTKGPPSWLKAAECEVCGKPATHSPDPGNCGSDAFLCDGCYAQSARAPEAGT